MVSGRHWQDAEATFLMLQSGGGTMTDFAKHRAAAGRTRLWVPAWALWRREVVRFLRQRNRIVGALAILGICD